MKSYGFSAGTKPYSSVHEHAEFSSIVQVAAHPVLIHGLLESSIESGLGKASFNLAESLTVVEEEVFIWMPQEEPHFEFQELLLLV